MFETDGTRNPLFSKHPFVQAIDEREFFSPVELQL